MRQQINQTLSTDTLRVTVVDDQHRRFDPEYINTVINDATTSWGTARKRYQIGVNFDESDLGNHPPNMGDDVMLIISAGEYRHRKYSDSSESITTTVEATVDDIQGPKGLDVVFETGVMTPNNDVERALEIAES